MFVASLFGSFRLPRRRPRPGSPRFRPQLVGLEDRTVPSPFTVLNLDDSGVGSLRAAVLAADAASGPSTITFAPRLHGSITLTSGELLISNSVTITGPGADRVTVSGDNASRVFEIATGLNVLVSGLTVSDGSALDLGGGILNDGSNLTLSKDDLSHNVAFEGTTDTNGAQGGGLASLGGVVTITDSTIADNGALGGADSSASGQAYGGGLILTAGRATIQNSTFSDNRAEGGADSSFGASAGGAIDTGGASYTDSVPLVILTSTFVDNRATASASAPSNASTGGAISTGMGATSISGSTFEQNQAVGGNGGVYGFAGEAEGGAIANYGPLTISGTTFDQNQARAGSGGSDPGFVDADPSVDVAYGGAIFSLYGPGTDFLDASLTVTGSSFSRNEAIGGSNATATGTDIVEAGSAEGGALGSEIGVATTVSGCDFDDNQAVGGSGNSGSGPVVDAGTGFGGAILSGFGGSLLGTTTLTITDSAFTHNSARGGSNNTGTASVAGFVGDGVGGSIANYLGGTVNVSASVLDNGRASGGGGNAAGGTGSVFAGLGAGGGIFNGLANYDSSGYGQLSAAVVTVSGSLIDLNRAQGGGGGNGEGGGIADVLAAMTTVSDSVLTLNEANGGSRAGLGGGAFNDATSSLALAASLVSLNEANGASGVGGGVYTAGTFTEATSLILFNDASTSGDNVGT